MNKDTKTKDILLRDVPAALVERIDAQADGAGMSRQEYLLAYLQDMFGTFSADLVLGYVRLTESEIPSDTDCPECDMPFGDTGVWLGFTGALRPFGPVCGRCATTE